MRLHRVPGVVLGVAANGSVDIAGYGVEGIHTGRPVTPGSVVAIGSITKVYTATAVMQLVASGHLHLSQPVVSLLPTLRLPRSLTVQHLLTHQAGWHGDVSAAPGQSLREYCKALPALAEYQCEPGTITAYNNSAFSLLGAVIETVTGHTWADHLRTALLAPTELSETTTAPGHDGGWVGHYLSGPAHKPTPVLGGGCPTALAPAGGLRATAADLLKFAARHMSPAAPLPGLSAADLSAMRRPLVRGLSISAHIGLSWMMDPGARTVWHGGRVAGQSALLVLAPQTGAVAFAAANSDTGHLLLRTLCDQTLSHHVTKAAARSRSSAPITVGLAPGTFTAGSTWVTLSSATPGEQEGTAVRLSMGEGGAPAAITDPTGPYDARVADLTPGVGVWTAQTGYYSGRRALLLDHDGGAATSPDAPWLHWLGRLFRRHS